VNHLSRKPEKVQIPILAVFTESSINCPLPLANILLQKYGNGSGYILN